jgi:hypothetical protein
VDGAGALAVDDEAFLGGFFLLLFFLFPIDGMRGGFGL